MYFVSSVSNELNILGPDLRGVFQAADDLLVKPPFAEVHGREKKSAADGRRECEWGLGAGGRLSAKAGICARGFRWSAVRGMFSREGGVYDLSQAW